MIRRIKHIEERRLNGMKVTINFMERIQYNGRWESDGYDVEVNGKQMFTFVGYPTNHDILSRITPER